MDKDDENTDDLRCRDTARGAALWGLASRLMRDWTEATVQDTRIAARTVPALTVPVLRGGARQPSLRRAWQ